MKDKKMMAYTILRMSLALCGMAFVIADMVTENGENRYLPIGMLFIALANIYSKKGYCLIGKAENKRQLILAVAFGLSHFRDLAFKS